MRRHLLLLFLLATFLGCDTTADPYAAGSSPGDDADSLGVLTGDDADALDDGGAESGDPAWDDGASPVVDAGSAGPWVDSAAPAEGGPAGACDFPIGPGDLVIDELMIESVAGVGRLRRVARGREHGRLRRGPRRAFTATAPSAPRSTRST